MSSSASRERTSVGLTRSTYDRLDELRPFDSLSWDEWLSELARVYEENQENSER